MYKNLLLVNLILLISQNIDCQIRDRNYYLNMSKAIGFYLGTELLCDKIIETHPLISGEMLALKLEFQNAHKNAKDKMVKEMESLKLINKESSEAMQYNYSSKNEYSTIGLSEAREYLKYFKNDIIQGNNVKYADYVKVLLGNNKYYNNNPELEMRNGFTKSIRCSKLSEGLNIILKFKIPTSWNQIENDNSNVYFEGDNYTESCKMLIGVKNIITEIKKGGGDVDAEMEKKYKSNEFGEDAYSNLYNKQYGLNFFNKIHLENVSEFEFEKTRIKGNPGFIVKGYGYMINGVEKNHNYVINFVFIYKNYIIDWSFKINNALTNFNEKSKLVPLINTIINTLNIEEI